MSKNFVFKLHSLVSQIKLLQRLFFFFFNSVVINCLFLSSQYLQFLHMLFLTASFLLQIHYCFVYLCKHCLFQKLFVIDCFLIFGACQLGSLIEIFYVCWVWYCCAELINALFLLNRPQLSFNISVYVAFYVFVVSSVVVAFICAFGLYFNLFKLSFLI